MGRNINVRPMVSPEELAAIVVKRKETLMAQGLDFKANPKQGVHGNISKKTKVDKVKLAKMEMFICGSNRVSTVVVVVSTLH